MRRLLSPRNLIFALFVTLAVVPFLANKYYVFIANLVLLYMILAVGLNLLIGYAGQLAFANAAMFGIGAYGAGLLQAHFGVPYWLALPSGALIAMVSGTVMALPALRLSGIYLALVTLAFAQFTLWVMSHWDTVTFGAGGFSPPRIDFGPLPLTQPNGMYLLSWLAAAGLIWFAWNAMGSRIGRAFVAMRDGEIAAQALGIDLLRYKALAFALSGFYAGTAGALYGGVLGFVGPEGFDLLQMVLHKAAVVMGGLGSIMGSIIGAVILVVLLEVIREFKATMEIAFGGLLLAFVLFQPRGIVDLLRRKLGWDERLHYKAGPDQTAPSEPTPAATRKPAE
ncbi:MAG: branched-chain amino acid ABC transporter permease [Alphaproteobacteria bacterium]|nr:branched-chain amino acid ABC transporter permease [Alphaproteobacteria bacterium]